MWYFNKLRIISEKKCSILLLQNNYGSQIKILLTEGTIYRGIKLLICYPAVIAFECTEVVNSFY